VSRRQSAVMSGELDVASGVADFRLIDPPRVSPKPVSPNRLILLPMALVAAIGCGLVLAFAAASCGRCSATPHELRQQDGPAAARGGHAVTERRRRRRERA
jgi:capsular polysaccharide biosynthesis protein